ncbi:hypothetical protein SAMN05428642_10384 [Flaviramulus basaltis]|uniref:Uncharacterized protein n=1 Tax=Flaviramulus basaltis TaxID=369401 RepID=A0A1K2ILV6_9FLAO|nr:hypothetical protein [Flaviramulus basaltis]SFZ93351.1 hypothetical protein SAMN05428642_10384 [Flaviramulus basaltis]
MNKITELTELKVGNKIYAPKLDTYYLIVEYSYNDIHKDMYTNLSPSKENPNENGFMATLSTMIELGYYKC